MSEKKSQGTNYQDMEKTALWDNHFTKNKCKVEELFRFLKFKTHRQFNKNFHYKATKILLSPHHSAREKLYFLFVNCLNAAGGRNLKFSAEGFRSLVPALEKLPTSQTIPVTDFYSAIASTTQPKAITNSKTLFSCLCDGRFKNFRYKKAALFMKSLQCAQEHKELRIFSDIEPKDIHTPIPLDVIIGEIFSIIIGLPYKNRIQSGHAEEFNTWAVPKLDKNYYLIEDIWLWGYFGTTVGETKGYRTVEYNHGKFVTTEWMFPSGDKLKQYTEEFCSIVNGNGT
jgi:hypothetical protein